MDNYINIWKPISFLRKTVEKVDVVGNAINNAQHPMFGYCWTMDGNEPSPFGPVLGSVREPPEYVVAGIFAAVLSHEICGENGEGVGMRRWE